MIDKSDYHEQKKLNEDQFKEIIKYSRPDIWAIMNTLDETGVNWKVIWKVIYALQNIALGTKYGQVNILIENNVVRFVRGESADKLNEPILINEETSQEKDVNLTNDS